MQKQILFLLLLCCGTSLSAQDFMLQGWYWDYDKDGCNGYTGPNWTTTLDGKVTDLANAGFTYVWLPPASRASFGACSNGYDPQDLYDLGEFGGGRTGFGTRAEVDALITSLNTGGIEAVADVVYNHRDGGVAEDNQAVKDYVETHFDGNGKQPFPSDRYRLRLPLGGTYGAGDYYIKISSKTQSYGANQYRFRATVDGTAGTNQSAISESEPNGGGDCGQPFNDVLLDQDLTATLFDYSGCYTDEFKLSISGTDFDASGDDLLIFMTNVNSGYSDHRIYGIYYAPADGSAGSNVDLADLKFQTYTDFTNLPSAQGGMNFENFRPNTANTSSTYMAGDFDSPLFFYDVVQAEASTKTVYNDWTNWLLTDAGFGGLRMDAVKHFPPDFVSQLLDDLAADGINPGMVVGEFFDGNPTLLKDWVDAVNAGITSSTSLVRIFDFTLRNALKEACDNGGYDRRNVFNSSLRDNGLSGHNVATFVNNHDFRGPGEPVQNDALLAYAYILTNNQLGVPTVFYPDLFGTVIPNAPVMNLQTEIAQLMSIHKEHIFGAPTVEYLNRFSTPYGADYQIGSANDALIYQISNGGLSSDDEVVVAINFGNQTLKVNHAINVPVNRGSNTAALTFTDMTGNAFNSTATTDGTDRLLIDVPARSYAVYVKTAALPVELLTFTAMAGPKGKVDLHWQSSSESDLSHFTIEASTAGGAFAEIGRVQARNEPSVYELEDDRPWEVMERTYRILMTDRDGTERIGPLRDVSFKLTNIVITPNPADDMLRVNGLSASTAWSLTSSDGRTAAVRILSDGDELVLDVSQLPSGLYLFKSDGVARKVMIR
jgi:alpha-amylase